MFRPSNRRLATLVAASTLLTAFATTGCIVHHPHHSSHTRVRSVPIPVVANHGYVHHHHGVVLVFDSVWGGYRVRDHHDHYFYRDTYYRLHDGRWHRAKAWGGPWTVVSERRIPSRLHKHAHRPPADPQASHPPARSVVERVRAQRAHEERREDRREEARDRREHRHEEARDRREDRHDEARPRHAEARDARQVGRERGQGRHEQQVEKPPGKNEGAQGRSEPSPKKRIMEGKRPRPKPRKSDEDAAETENHPAKRRDR